MLKKTAAWIFLFPVISLSLMACNQKKSSPNDAPDLKLKGDLLAPHKPGDGLPENAVTKPASDNGGATDSQPPAGSGNGTDNISGALSSAVSLDQNVLNHSTNALQKIDPYVFMALHPEGETHKGPQIQILNQDLLVKIDTKEPLVLFQNSLQTKDRAMTVLYDRGQGIFCQTSHADQIHKDETFSMIDGDVKASEKDKTLEITTFVYRTSDGKPLEVICTTRGKVSIQEYQENFKEVLHFIEDDPAKASNAPNNSRRETSEEMAANDLKMQSFRILDVETLSKTVVLENQLNQSLSLMAGKLVKGTDAQKQITLGQAEEACQVARLKGDLSKSKVYSVTDRTLLAADQVRRTALLAYTYAAGEKDVITFYCFVRMSTSAIEIFNVFNGVLEFGAAQPATTQPDSK